MDHPLLPGQFQRLFNDKQSVLPVWIQGEEMLLMGLHRSSEDEGGLSTLFTENVRLSRVIFSRIDCHIFTDFLFLG